MRPITLLLVLLPLLAHAQVVNIENKHFEDDPARWSAQMGVRFNVVQNTNGVRTWGAKGGVQFIHDIHRPFFITDFSLNRVEANTFTNRGSATCATSASGGDLSPGRDIRNYSTTSCCASMQGG